MSTLIEEDNITRWLQREDIRGRIGGALGGCMDADMFLEGVLIALTQPYLDECTMKSKFEAAHICASLGMLPTLNHVALIPRKLKEHNYDICCTVLPQWQGLQALMLRHPDVCDITHSLVHPDDKFNFTGTDSTVTHHEFDPFDREFETFDHIRGGYLRISFHDRRPDKYHMVSRKKIEQARNCADSGKFWGPWFEEQCIKTLYRNGYARRAVPVDPRGNEQHLKAAMVQEDAILGNDPQRVKVITQQPTEASRSKAYAEKLNPQPDEPATEPATITRLAELEDQVVTLSSADKSEQMTAEIELSFNEGDITAADRDELRELLNTSMDGLAAATTGNTEVPDGR